MTAPHIIGTLLQPRLNPLLPADAEAVVVAEWGNPPLDRSTRRNGYRHRDLDTRVGTLDVAVPKLRQGTYFPEWLLERRKRAESRLMDKLVKTLGINALSKSQVSRMAADLDEQVEAFRHRPLDEAGPFTFVAADALTMKVREGGRVVNAVALLATGVNGDGHREVLGLRVATSETGSAWNEFFADLVARGLAGVRLVTSDAHAGLKDAIAANLLGALPDPLRGEPDGHHPEADVASGEGDAAQRVRPARRRGCGCPVRPAPGLRGREAAAGRRAPRCGPGGHPGLHHVPEGRLGPDLVEQPS
ncbi:Transposase, Mutator family [Brevibacterium aurantiacum]|uniref:Mutator family transposase n=1 Tax=Brevibacterium aurantiacum TaxID=273384 RepID=A0A2H1KWQ1_BREAU|nr:Transposase, Mutator family [Brevibacterium aurantiacum]